MDLSTSICAALIMSSAPKAEIPLRTVYTLIDEIKSLLGQMRSSSTILIPGGPQDAIGTGGLHKGLDDGANMTTSLSSTLSCHNLSEPTMHWHYAVLARIQQLRNVLNISKVAQETICGMHLSPPLVMATRRSLDTMFFRLGDYVSDHNKPKAIEDALKLFSTSTQREVADVDIQEGRIDIAAALSSAIIRECALIPNVNPIDVTNTSTDSTLSQSLSQSVSSDKGITQVRPPNHKAQLSIATVGDSDCTAIDVTVDSGYPGGVSSASITRIVSDEEWPIPHGQDQLEAILRQTVRVPGRGYARSGRSIGPNPPHTSLPLVPVSSTAFTNKSFINGYLPATALHRYLTSHNTVLPLSFYPNEGLGHSLTTEGVSHLMTVTRRIVLQEHQRKTSPTFKLHTMANTVAEVMQKACSLYESSSSNNAMTDNVTSTSSTTSPSSLLNTPHTENSHPRISQYCYRSSHPKCVGLCEGPSLIFAGTECGHPTCLVCAPIHSPPDSSLSSTPISSSSPFLEIASLVTPVLGPHALTCTGATLPPPRDSQLFSPSLPLAPDLVLKAALATVGRSDGPTPSINLDPPIAMSVDDAQRLIAILRTNSQPSRSSTPSTQPSSTPSTNPSAPTSESIPPSQSTVSYLALTASHSQKSGPESITTNVPTDLSTIPSNVSLLSVLTSAPYRATHFASPGKVSGTETASTSTSSPLVSCLPSVDVNTCLRTTSSLFNLSTQESIGSTPTTKGLLSPSFTSSDSDSSTSLDTPPIDSDTLSSSLLQLPPLTPITTSLSPIRSTTTTSTSSTHPTSSTTPYVDTPSSSSVSPRPPAPSPFFTPSPFASSLSRTSTHTGSSLPPTQLPFSDSIVSSSILTATHPLLGTTLQISLTPSSLSRLFARSILVSRLPTSLNEFNGTTGPLPGIDPELPVKGAAHNQPNPTSSSSTSSAPATGVATSSSSTSTGTGGGERNPSDTNSQLVTTWLTPRGLVSVVDELNKQLSLHQLILSLLGDASLTVDTSRLPYTYDNAIVNRVVEKIKVRESTRGDTLNRDLLSNESSRTRTTADNNNKEKHTGAVENSDIIEEGNDDDDEEEDEGLDNIGDELQLILSYQDHPSNKKRDKKAKKNEVDHEKQDISLNLLSETSSAPPIRSGSFSLLHVTLDFPSQWIVRVQVTVPNYDSTSRGNYDNTTNSPSTLVAVSNTGFSIITVEVDAASPVYSPARVKVFKRTTMSSTSSLSTIDQITDTVGEYDSTLTTEVASVLITTGSLAAAIVYMTRPVHLT